MVGALGLPENFGLDSSSILNFGFWETIPKSTISFTIIENSCTRISSPGIPELTEWLCEFL